jgi:hypothetical protein
MISDSLILESGYTKPHNLVKCSGVDSDSWNVDRRYSQFTADGSFGNTYI